MNERFEQRSNQARHRNYEYIPSPRPPLLRAQAPVGVHDDG